MSASPSAPLIAVTQIAPASVGERDPVVRRTRALARASLGWHLIEAGVGIAAGAVAGSVALVGFGADSLIEVAAGGVILWLMRGGRSGFVGAERRAQQLIAASFVLLGVYVGAQTISDLVSGSHPGVSRIGIALSIVTVLTMPPLAAAKRRVGVALGSSATVSESRQTMLCAYLSAGLLVGLAANAVFGWWWADLLVAVVIGLVALREAQDAWRGESCGCC